ncbi:MAG: DUF6624 domain-containing protein [Bacteroidales bacterium]
MRKLWAKNNFNPKYYNEKLDKTNTEEFEKIISKIGWPSKSKVGKIASDYAWVLIQHTKDNKLANKALILMKNLPAGEQDWNKISKTIDRIRVKKGQPQLYGTSFKIDIKTKKLSVDTIYDIKNIDKRRKKIGLEESFKVFKARVIKDYNFFLKQKK